MKLEESLKANPELRNAQKTLAFEITKLMHGTDEADEAVKVSNALFSGDFKTLKGSSFELLENTLKTVKITGAFDINAVLVELELASSKREAREFINNGAISVNDEKIDLDYAFDVKKAYQEKYVVVKRGRRKYGLIVLK